MDTAQRVALVVEDDADIRELLTHSLAMQGFAVHSTSSGHTALEIVRQQTPDLVTLDLGLPDLDGVEVCRRIRQESDAYIVMISARVDEIDRLIGLETGADDYLTKPFSPRELHARVNAMFRRPRQSNGSTPDRPTAGVSPTAAQAPEPAEAPDESLVTLGRISVDTDSRIAAIDGQEVELTRTEFDLLATRIDKPRRVWGRDVLLRTIWGEGWTEDEHLVEVHVGNLRRKLGRAATPAAPMPFIRTVRGVGYRMEDPAQLDVQRTC
ncbi:MAG: response regulator transcription factor [Intrasporangium sp.]|uniref:response regulator transcription factor n=1 Tax=Intrasporangium sp. TaxID=1925024 RepID=UPI003F7F8310